MLSLLKVLLLQGFLAKTALRSFAWLAWMLPLGFLFKWVGLPILAVLGVLALPVLLLLAVIGLPLIVVVVFSSILLSITGAVLTFGLAAAKVLIPIVLVVMLLRWLPRWLLRSREPLSSNEVPSAQPQ